MTTALRRGVPSPASRPRTHLQQLGEASVVKGPGGHSGATLQSSSSGPTPAAGPSDTSLPGPAKPDATPALPVGIHVTERGATSHTPEHGARCGHEQADHVRSDAGPARRRRASTVRRTGRGARRHRTAGARRVGRTPPRERASVRRVGAALDRLSSPSSTGQGPMCGLPSSLTGTAPREGVLG